MPRAVHVSTVWALGNSGPDAERAADESKRHDGRYLTAYERSKAQEAFGLREGPAFGRQGP